MTHQGDVYGVPFDRCSDAVLVREYQDMTKAAFGIFGRNAERQRKSVSAELIRRGITEIPNMFGPILVRA